MRPDEGGCADLRRSLTAHTKVVRSSAYAPARRRCPRAGSPVFIRCARGLSAALEDYLVSARDDGDVTGCIVGVGHRPVLGDQTPYGHGVLGKPGLAFFAEVGPRDACPAAGGGDLDGLLDRGHVRG